MRRSAGLRRLATDSGVAVPRALMLTLLVALSASGVTATAAVASAGPRVVPPVGRLYDDLSVAWWRYVLAQPKATNPLLDQTGAHCADAQPGGVFFLVGVSTSGAVTRDECVVPPRTRLFFPLANAFDVHTPGDGLDTPTAVLEDFLGFEFRADSLRASVDGIPVGDLDPASTPYGACAGPLPGCATTFSLDLPDDNLFGIAAGTYAPGVAAGYYLLLRPLRRGMHTIAFGSTGNFSGAKSQDITYHLRVGRPRP
jgi:hypothetical protein